MKLLNKKILGISKLVLLFNLFTVGVTSWGQEVISSDRFIFRILDRTVSFQDMVYQVRNLKALNCIYSDALVIQYFKPSIIQEWEKFVDKFPQEEKAINLYLHENEKILKKMRYFFKMLRYSQDQNRKLSPQITNLIKEGTKENKCGMDILYKDTLKTNFKQLIEMELYLRSRYEGQLKSDKRNFDSIRASIDLFIESLDKQFGHEYYW